MNKSVMRATLHLTMTLLLTLVSGTSAADDTEIYYNGATSLGQPIRPNVLLILDSSGSMDATVSGTGQTRMQVMKEAMTEIITGLEEVNVGLMRFTNDDGGPVLFPVSYIDDPAANVVSEPDDTNPGFSYTISSGTDDAEEDLGTGDVTLADPVLDVARFDNSAGNFLQQVSASANDADEYVGSTNTTSAFWVDANGNTMDAARFTGVTVPQGATITWATFRLSPLFGTGGDTTLSGHDVDNSSAFTDTANDISTRNKTGASVTWNFADTAVEEKDVTAIIQEIVNRAGWSGGNALSIISHDSGGTRRFHSFDTDAARAPELEIQYSTGASPVEQMIGLRFPGVDIPQGATVTGARLVLTPTSTQNGGSGQWSIKGEDADDAATFSATNGDLSGRPTTAASVSWSTPDTNVDVAVTSPELTAVVQEIVNRAGWCAGNGMALLMQTLSGSDTRFFHGYEGDAAVAPKLEVSYDATSAAGCYRRTETAQVASDYDDVEEDDGTMQRTSGDLDLSEKKVGVRFPGIDIPQGATILDATLEFNADGTSTTGNPNIDIYAENADNATQFTGSDDDLSNRSLTTASVNWTLGDFDTDGVWHSTPDISALVQEIVNRGGWVSGNALAFILDDGTQNRVTETHDGNPSQAPRLSITYESTAGATAVKTVRERLIELVNDMPTSDWTPLVETLYEAAHYWRGEQVVYGADRDDNPDTELSHPGSYCEEQSDGSLDCNGADVGSHPPYGIEYETWCDPDTPEWESYQCDDSFIRGGPDYISPFNSTLTCQSNYQIVLTDGEANRNGAEDEIQSEYLGGAGCLTNKSDGSAVTSGEECGIDLVEFLAENDQSSSLDNDQLVNSYTIGFNTSSLANATQFLTDVADAGDGRFYEASTASDLISVFNTILSDVRSDPTSFTSPSLATNAFNRLLSRDHIYFGLFTPSFEQRWDGNVKKYNVCVSSEDGDGDGDPDCSLGEILDANDNPAIDDSNDRFRDTAQSEWSAVIDGVETTAGGTGGETTDYTNRVLYTDAKSDGTAPALGTSLAFGDNPGFQIDNTTWDDADLAHVRAAVCPTPDTTAGSDCEDRMLWMLGKSLEGEDTDTSSTTRWTVSDVLHSSPITVTYGGDDSDSDGVVETFFDRLLVGTNEGGLRFINADTGREEWMFIPETFLEDQPSHFSNAEGEHLYGLDLTPTLRVNDDDGDGFIEPADGDFVHVIMGMRRGGNLVYALDITPDSTLGNNTTGITPKFLWRIDASTAGYGRLADTWSQPQVATIQTTSGFKEVLIFAGGYDASLDSGFGTAATGGADNLGNAIYITNPDDGSLIMSISGSGSGADIEVPEMQFSIPSRISVLDTDGDSIDDRLYVGDTGGQVWRVDLGEDIKLSGAGVEGSSVVGRLADIATAGGTPPVDERRIFEPPSVVQVKDTVYSDAANGEYDYVMVGTGNRAHPLDSDVSDRFFAFRDGFIGSLPDADNDNLADSSYPQTGGAITPAEMVDVTSTVLDSSDTTHVESMGWYFDFDTAGTDGEKVLSAPTTIAGSVLFTTYIPGSGSGSDICSANIGGGAAYNLDILSTRASLDWDADGSVEDLADRRMTLGGGIPSDVVPVFTKEGVVGIVGVEGGASQLGQVSALPRYTTYWYEKD